MNNNSIMNIMNNIASEFNLLMLIYKPIILKQSMGMRKD